MTQQNKDHQTKEETAHETDFNGAALIDENGNEIPITEEMIQSACEELDSTDK